jgi:hypothetical protein
VFQLSTSSEKPRELIELAYDRPDLPPFLESTLAVPAILTVRFGRLTDTFSTGPQVFKSGPLASGERFLIRARTAFWEIDRYPEALPKRFAVKAVGTFRLHCKSNLPGRFTCQI